MRFKEILFLSHSHLYTKHNTNLVLYTNLISNRVLYTKAEVWLLYVDPQLLYTKVITAGNGRVLLRLPPSKELTASTLHKFDVLNLSKVISRSLP